MIYFGFNIANPWSKRWSNVWTRVYHMPVEYKYIELEVFEDNTIVSFSVKLATRTDHSGVNIDIGLLGYTFNFNFYDIRHWNSEAGRYYIYDEENGSH